MAQQHTQGREREEAGETGASEGATEDPRHYTGPCLPRSPARPGAVCLLPHSKGSDFWWPYSTARRWDGTCNERPCEPLKCS